MGREVYERMSSLPPMSSFHQDANPGQRFHHATPVSPPLTNTEPSVMGKTFKDLTVEAGRCSLAYTALQYSLTSWLERLTSILLRFYCRFTAKLF